MRPIIVPVVSNSVCILEFSGLQVSPSSIRDKLNRIPWRWDPRNCILRSSPGDSVIDPRLTIRHSTILPPATSVSLQHCTEGSYQTIASYVVGQLSPREQKAVAELKMEGTLLQIIISFPLTAVL